MLGVGAGLNAYLSAKRGFAPSTGKTPVLMSAPYGRQLANDSTNKRMNADIKVEIRDGYLHIQLPMNPTPVASASGKTLVVASTHGNIATAALVDGKPVTIWVNAYIRR